MILKFALLIQLSVKNQLRFIGILLQWEKGILLNDDVAGFYVKQPIGSE